MILVFLVFTIVFTTPTTGQISTATTHRDGEGTILRALQEDVNNLKIEQASTLHQLSSTLSHLSSALSQVADLQHEQNVLRQELRKEQAYRVTLQEEVNRLKSKGCQCDNSSRDNGSVLLPPDVQTVKEAIRFDLQLEMKQQNDSIMGEMSRVERDVHDVKAKNRAIAMTISGLVSSDLQTQIYFSVGTIRDINKQWKPNEIIVFPHILANIGGGYDATSGVFTVPKTGVYVLSCFLSTHTSTFYAKLILNGNPVAGITAVTNDVSDVDTGGNLVVSQFQQGDRIWIQFSGGHFLWTLSDASVSTFSGFLLR